MKHSIFSVTLLLACSALVLATPIVLGQQATSEGPGSGDPELKLSPLKALQRFEPQPTEEYSLGPGDQISLDFPGHPELNEKKVVGPDGRITLTLAGAISIGDKTRNEAATLVVDALSPYYKNLSVTISIDKYGSNRVVIIGSVQHPGVLYFDETPTLLDVIARAGLLAPSTTPASTASNAGDGIPARCAIYRGNDQVVWVDLRQMLQSGSAMADLRLRRNDIVYVPAQQQVFVSVLGSVMHPGAVPLTPESTLASVLAQSGGLAEGAGGNIEIIQPSLDKTVIVPFKRLLTLTGTDEVRLHAGDVIYIPKSGFYQFTYVIQRLSPIAQVGTLTAIAH
jgi:polysaccharide export outer membrane protein